MVRHDHADKCIRVEERNLFRTISETEDARQHYFLEAWVGTFDMKTMTAYRFKLTIGPSEPIQ